MSEDKPFDTCSLSKDDVMMDHEDTSLEHIIKTEEVDLEPDYIEYNTDEPEIKVKDEQTDNCHIKVELNDDKQNVPINYTMDIETKAKISQYDNGNSEIYQEIKINNIKLEIETNDETSVDELNKRHESDTDTDVVCHAETDRHSDINIKTEINKTKKVKNAGKFHICDICNESCPSACSLRRHTIEEHASKITPYTRNKLKQKTKTYSCNECTYKCVKKITLIRHMKLHGEKGLLTHPGNKPFACHICNSNFKEKRYLKMHMSTHTDDKPFSCKNCNYKCKQKGNLRIHMRTHTADKPFSCNSCDFKCKQKGNLTIHMRTHTNDKPFLCDICNYESIRKSSLKLHMMSHTDVKPLSCDICDYKCNQRCKLNQHIMTVHTGDKPYSCNICSFKTSRKDSLNQHMRRHTGVKPYSCVECDYKSAHRKLLVRHMKTHRGEKSCI